MSPNVVCACLHDAYSSIVVSFSFQEYGIQLPLKQTGGFLKHCKLSAGATRRVLIDLGHVRFAPITTILVQPQQLR
jgi:hypothetical protein